MTGPRNAAAVASLVLLCAAAGCTNFYEIPIETPIQPKMDVTPFTRILVAGFISGGSDDVDGCRWRWWRRGRRQQRHSAIQRNHRRRSRSAAR